MSTPNLIAGIPDNFLPLKFVDDAGPTIVAVDKSAIHFDPPGSAPGTDEEWEVVAGSIGKTLEPLLPDLLLEYGADRSTESGVRWRHVDLTAERLAKEGIDLRTQAHHMLRHSSWGGRTTPRS
jgi:hypothetical protein